MPKKVTFTGKNRKRIKVASKPYPKVDAEELAKALGAEVVTDPKEIAKLQKKSRRRP